jgi:hypothetical protein
LTQSTRSSSQPPTIELYRIMPVFKDSMLPALGLLATRKTAEAFQSNATPENWTALFRNELQWLLTLALRTGQIDGQGMNLLAERWLTPRATAEVIGATLSTKPVIFADLVVSGGMLIDPDSPFQMAREYLQARLERARDRQEEIIKRAEGRSFGMNIRTDEFLALDPMERLEMMLSNLSMRGPNGGMASPKPLPRRTTSAT